MESLLSTGPTPSSFLINELAQQGEVLSAGEDAWNFLQLIAGVWLLQVILMDPHCNAGIRIFGVSLA